MATLCLLLLSTTLLFPAAQSQLTLNFTADAEAAMADMWAKSYFGFVIILKVLLRSPNFLHTSEVTFLMPTDKQLASPQLNLHHLADFVLTHTIPMSLVFNNLMHFPNGTMVPTSLPGKMVTVNTNNGLFLNNARIVNPNICVNSMIKCHGISSAITFDNHHNLDAPPDGGDAPSSPPPTGDMVGPSSMFHLKRNSTIS